MSRSNYQTVLITGAARQQMAASKKAVPRSYMGRIRGYLRHETLSSRPVLPSFTICDLPTAMRSRGRRKVLEEVGAIDVLVNNAGIVSGKSPEISDEEIVRTFEVVASPLLDDACFLLKCPAKGHIFTIASRLASSAYRSY